MSQSILLQVVESAGIDRKQCPVSRGVPLPEGLLQNIDDVWVANANGERVPAQFCVLGQWPDGSLKWVLVDFQVDISAHGESSYFVRWDNPAKAVDKSFLHVSKSDTHIEVCTGALRFSVNCKQFSLLEDVALGRVSGDGEFVPEVNLPNAGGDAWVRICEGSVDAEGNRFLYGMGGDCLASLVTDDYSVTVEESGPLRVVIRCEGTFEADLPMHHYAGYRPFHFVMRLYTYAGQATVRVLHTVVVACNPREVEAEAIALRVRGVVNGDRIVRTGQFETALNAEASVLLSQCTDNHFQLLQHVGDQARTLVEGERADGWMAIEDDVVGVGVGLRYMAEEFPKALSTTSNGLDVYMWHNADDKRLSFKRYAEPVTWGAGEGVYADGLGTAKTSELFLHFYQTRDRELVPNVLRGWLATPCVHLDPEWASSCAVLGDFAACGAERFPGPERMLTGFADWMDRNVHLGRWYGFFNWGDVRAAWEESENDWRFHGRWGWCNSEWDPRHALWIQYVRTGEARYFALAEAMTRHSVDVDTCHYHPLRPYWVGGCFRHSVDHFGDEPCASHTFIDNWVDHYYLTGDLRTLEVIKEAGTFFLRYRWTEDPAFSFSLRSIANVLRGLLYVYEVTGEAHYLQRALAVYETIARGQNNDGSWHKRFQVSTSDHLPHQGPYGMATEGTTLAVELGTAAPFTDAEFWALRDKNVPRIYTLPISQQKGYQTHYLMIGLDLLHRLTKREDVANVYCKAVDWFCGGPGVFDAEMAVRERYGGVMCRLLGYAYRLTGEQRYLEVGRVVLRHLMDEQDWRDDPKRHGAIGMSPTYLSTLFFGVPFFLKTLKEADMEA